MSSSNPNFPPLQRERRGADRTRDDADWETKVLRRVESRIRKLPADSSTTGWESEVVDKLRRKIDRVK